MKTKNIFPEDVRNHAIQLVVEYHLTVVIAAELLHLPVDPVYVWVRRFRQKKLRESEGGHAATRLKNELQRAVHERDVMTHLAAKLLADRPGKRVG
jgi:transposase-like protein